MEFLAILSAARAAVNAAGAFKELYNDAKGALSKDQEAELKPLLDQLKASNDELYASVDAKLADAADD